MERQLANQKLSVEQPGPSRQPVKQHGRITNFYKENTNKNGCNRYQNNARQREKSSAKNFSKLPQTSRNHLSTPKVTVVSDYHYLPKKHNEKNFVKERFVQANCQFVVTGNQDYSKYIKDPDLFISWESIEEVIFSCKKDDDLRCPICLHYPTAAKITRCGHIYCWSCMLHYLSLSDKKSRPCPICFHNINKSDLKSATILRKENFSSNNYITFNLMKILKGSTLSVPVSKTELDINSINTKNFDPTLDLYRKIFFSSEQQRMELLNREQNELMEELIKYRNENMPEICFVESALEELTEKRLSINENIIFDEANVDLDPADYTYFYQCNDGQHIYPHAINIRMLKHEYQELKYCPMTIRGKVIDLHRKTITEDIRKRYAHLRHLPLSCEFTIAELELDNTIVSKETLDEFKSEINKRKKERKRKEAAQKIRDRNIDIENKKKFNMLSFSGFNVNNNDFPTYQLENEEFLSLSPDTNTAIIPEPEISIGSQSFANMLTSAAAGKLKFDETVRKKNVLQPTSAKTDIDDDENEPVFDLKDNTLSDYFDVCLKFGKKDKKHRKK